MWCHLGQCPTSTAIHNHRLFPTYFQRKDALLHSSTLALVSLVLAQPAEELLLGNELKLARVSVALKWPLVVVCL